MFFNSLQYLIFLPIVIVLYWILPRKLRAILLFVASYVFYAAWNPAYLLLLFGMTVFNYAAGFLLAGFGRGKPWCLALVVLANLGTLAYYKYTNFLLSSWSGLMSLANVPHDDMVVKIFLPLGISFFTFEFIHYIVDVYKGDEPEKNFILFALLPGYFPSQIAGPIKRYQHFIPQVKEPREFDLSNFEKGFVMVLHGLAKKVLLADNLAIFVDLVFANHSDFQTMTIWLACYAFGFQVYFDFSGYTDVAIGSALMMNIKLPPNFNVPYMANNTRELWQRWHISLSLWFRDYVYFPLGGSRCSNARIWLNLVVTMALVGLWHGAGWHFVIWGAFQGLCMIVYREWVKFYSGIEKLSEFIKSRLWHAIAILITYNTFALSGPFFRAADLPTAWEMHLRMLRIWEIVPTEPLKFLTAKGPVILPLILPLMIVLWIANIASEFLFRVNFWPRRPRWMQATYCAMLVILMLALMPDQSNRFIYFQF